MATTRIDQLPLATAESGHELPAMLSGVTYKVSVASIKDNAVSGWAQIYDPQNIHNDAFNLANMTGTIDVSKVVGAVKKAGDTMTGALKLPAPVAPEDAVNKAYVDNTGSTAAIGEVAPASPTDNSFWWQNSSGALFIRYKDVDSAQWVQVNTPGIGEALVDARAYGRMNAAWTEVLKYSELTTGGTALTISRPGGVVFSGTSGVAIQGSSGLSVSTAINAASGNFSGALTVGSTLTANYIVNANSTLNVYGVFNSMLGGQLGGYGYVTNCKSVLQFDWASSGGYFQFVSGSSGWHFGLPSVGWGTYNLTPSSYRHQFAFSGTCYYAFDPNFFFALTGSPTLGLSNYRWSTIYTTVAVNISSDARLKNTIAPLTGPELACARALKDIFRTFKINREGDGGKIHCGVVAQEVQEVFAAQGLDVTQYAFWQEDELYTEKWNEETLQYDKTMTGETELSIAYDELQCFVLAALMELL
jgi:hypothetical protein